MSLPDGDLVHINKRPNLDIFLREITSKFETYIFTAAMKVYAEPLLNELDPKGDMFRGRFYRDHCLFHPELGVYAKDLCDVLQKRKLMINEADGFDSSNCEECEHSCDERRIVLVDNNPLSFLPNPSNGILVSSFYDDPKDDTLEAVMELLHELEDVEDVRPVLHERFGLKDALNDVVRETSWR
jgi:CTD small phosphatase-like protein 2